MSLSVILVNFDFDCYFSQYVMVGDDALKEKIYDFGGWIIAERTSYILVPGTSTGTFLYDVKCWDDRKMT